MPAVISEVISRIEWNNATLSVWLHKAGRYDYHGVPESVYLAFLDAPSKGTFFNERIKNKYPG